MPYRFLSKELLKRIVLEEGETVLVDVEAGVEHLGRGVEAGIDRIVVVVDPTAEGVAIARMLKTEADKIDKPLYVVLNKITPDVEEIMMKKLEEEGLSATGMVGLDPEIFRSSLEGVPSELGEPSTMLLIFSLKSSNFFLSRPALCFDAV
jgi:CO dehydrogenase maturation factor